MNHFIEISQLSRNDIEHLLKRADYFKHTTNYPNLSQHTVAHLFYENSTRTRVSFELAAKHLSMNIVHLDMQTSSETKKETPEDTLRNLAAMGVDFFVIRHKEDHFQKNLANKLGNTVHIINAGDGKHAHPSQAMLDLMTIYEQKPTHQRLKIAIVGNLRHSRVANSLQGLCKTLEHDLTLVAPTIWQPEQVHYGQVTTSLAEGLENADVVICLRVQLERIKDNEAFDLETYHRDYAITAKTLQYAKPDAMVMHPGPLNRGVEIDDEVADGPQSFILKQVTNGVFMRMAIFETLHLQGAYDITY